MEDYVAIAAASSGIGWTLAKGYYTGWRTLLQTKMSNGALVFSTTIWISTPFAFLPFKDHMVWACISIAAAIVYASINIVTVWMRSQEKSA